MELLQKYAAKFFPATKYLDYAVRVESYTLTKAANLVLNVDGCIGALFLDLLHSSSMFTEVSPLSITSIVLYSSFNSGRCMQLFRAKLGFTELGSKLSISAHRIWQDKQKSVVMRYFLQGAGPSIYRFHKVGKLRVRVGIVLGQGCPVQLPLDSCI